MRVRHGTIAIATMLAQNGENVKFHMSKAPCHQDNPLISLKNVSKLPEACGV